MSKMEKEKIIEVQNVGVIYKERKSFFKSTSYEALHSLSFDVYKGETLGIIGRNGAGKSTLLRLLASIIKPDSGKIIHHTQSVSLMALAAGFDPNLSGKDNAIISGLLFGYTKKYIIENLSAIKEFSELQEFFLKPVKTYSSGMRARLAFSIAMYVSPDVLLIDEVLGVGDVSFRAKAEQAIADKVASDITVIVVTHSESQLVNLANRIVWIDRGGVRKSGLPSEVFPEYNINITFSTFGLGVSNYKLNNNYLVNFEIIEHFNDRVKANIVILNKRNNNMDSVKCKFVNDEISLLGPFDSPGYKKRYPEIIQAGKARYKGCEIPFDNEFTILCENEDGTENILSMTLTNYNKRT